MRSTRTSIARVAVIILIWVAGHAAAGVYSGGAGTAGDPYLISTAADLQELMVIDTDHGMHFVLTKDIDFLLPGLEVAEHIPIGITDAFSGTFDGAGFCIRGLAMRGYRYYGLFGVTSPSARIMNLGVESCRVTASYDSGLLVGLNEGGTITNCYATGSIVGIGNSFRLGGLVGKNDGGTITNCYATGSVSVLLETVFFDTRVTGLGGLVGNNSGPITNCYATGSISGTASQVNALGGLVGMNYGNAGAITNCYATAYISASASLEMVRIGGLVGENDGMITDCYATGDILLNSGPWGHIGGLVGRSRGVIDSTSFWNTHVEGWGGSIYGTAISSGEMRMRSTFTDAPASWDFTNTWQMQEGVTFPYLHIGIGAPPPVRGDLDGDGDVDFDDFRIMANNWLAGK